MSSMLPVAISDAPDVPPFPTATDFSTSHSDFAHSYSASQHNRSRSQPIPTNASSAAAADTLQFPVDIPIAQAQANLNITSLHSSPTSTHLNHSMSRTAETSLREEEKQRQMPLGDAPKDEVLLSRSGRDRLGESLFSSSLNSISSSPPAAAAAAVGAAASAASASAASPLRLMSASFHASNRSALHSERERRSELAVRELQQKQREFDRQELQHEHERDIDRIQKDHELQLSQREKEHNFAQADLLSAFQIDRAAADKRNQAKVDALHAQLAQTQHELRAHQQLYADYSVQIQQELQVLKAEVLEAEHRSVEQATTIQTQESNVQDLSNTVAALHAERVKKDAEHAAALEVLQQQEKDGRVQWEQQLVQQSNAVLLLKQESFDMERHEHSILVQTLSAQLEAQTQARVEFERRLMESETKNNQLQQNVQKLESQTKEQEISLQTQKDLSSELTEAQSALQNLLASTQHELTTTKQQLQRTENEYQQLERIFKSTNDESGSQIQQLQSDNHEAMKALDSVTRTRDQVVKLLRESTEDRLALQHTFLKLQSKSRLRKLFCHWICITQARKYRHREMQIVLGGRRRSMQTQALQQLRLFATHRKYKEHIAARFAALMRKSHTRRAFARWASDTRTKRVQHDTQQFESEREKKIRLFKLLNDERLKYDEVKRSYEQQLNACETARLKEQIELKSCQDALLKLQGDYRRLTEGHSAKLQADTAAQRALQEAFRAQVNSHAISASPTATAAATAAAIVAAMSPMKVASNPPPALSSSSYYAPLSPRTPSPPVSSSSTSVASLPATAAGVAAQASNNINVAADTPAGIQISLEAMPSTPSQQLNQHKNELQELLSNARTSVANASPASVLQRTDLQDLEHSIRTEQSRLAALTQLRQQREAEEFQRAQLGAALALQPLTSGFFPSYAQTRATLSDRTAPLTALSASNAAATVAANKQRRLSQPSKSILSSTSSMRAKGRRAVQFQREGH